MKTGLAAIIIGAVALVLLGKNPGDGEHGQLMTPRSQASSTRAARRA